MRFIVTARLILAALAIAGSFACSAEERAATDMSWLIGHWHVTSDQDRKNSDLGTVLEFLPNGGVVVYDNDCDAENDPSEVSYTVEGRDIYVTNHLHGGDHTALTLHSSGNRKKLFLTWPNTRTVATLERVAENSCVKQS